MKYKWKTTNKNLFYFDQSILQIYRLFLFILPPFRRGVILIPEGF
jgi:hypothetical protein